MVGNEDEDNEVNDCSKYDDEVGEREEPGFSFPGDWVQEEDESYSKYVMQPRATREELDDLDVVNDHNKIMT